MSRSTGGITAHNITRRVKEAAKDGKVIVTDHAANRAAERNVTTKQLVEVAKSGMQVKTEPPDREGLNPKTTMQRRVAGDDICIVATIDEVDGQTAVVITTWKRC